MAENLALSEYTNLFVQRQPRFAMKKPGAKRWRTMKKGLGDDLVQKHLSGSLNIASLGSWYPHSATLDFDDTDLTHVEKIRESLALNDSNSELNLSESANSYHLHLVPRWNGAPATLNGLHMKLGDIAHYYGFELYPQAEKPFRLPWGPEQRCLDGEKVFLNKWEERLYWFEKLDEYDLGNAPVLQGELPFGFDEIKETSIETGRLSWKEEGRFLFEHGLQYTCSRHESQAKVLYWLWRENVPPETAIRTVYDWIKSKHNGFSKDIEKRRYRDIFAEINRQAHYIWNEYTLPDSASLNEFGWLTKKDIPEIFRLSQGSLPRANFLFKLIRYAYPRRHRKNGISIHSDRLKLWSSKRSYIQRIDELKQLQVFNSNGIKVPLLNRGTQYLENVYSKKIYIHWEWESIESRVLKEGRSPITLEETCKAAYPERAELKKVLELAGMEKRSRNTYLKKIYV